MEKFTAEEAEKVYLASGFANPQLAEDIASSLGAELGPVAGRTHPNGELYVRFEDNVRGRHVFIIQPHIGSGSHTVNDAIMEQNLLASAARSASASEITAVAPYLGYTRQDRKTRGRESIAVATIIDNLANAGVDRILAVDMHAPQSQGIFRGPFDHLTAQHLLRKAVKEELNGFNLDDCVVVAPDAGATKMANRHSKELGVKVLHFMKTRDPKDSQKIHRDEKVPEVDGRVCLLFDDMIDTAGTLVTAAEVLMNSGAKGVIAAATHGILSDPAVERLRDAPLNRVIVTDTFVTDGPKEALGNKLRVVSTAPLIGQAIIEIVRCGSISQHYDNEEHYS